MVLNVSENSSRQALKNYAKFVLDSHLDNATSENISSARKLNLPLLKVLAHLSEEQLFEVSKEGLKNFIESINLGTAIETTHSSIQNWKLNQLPNVGKTEISGTDLIFIYSIRKRSLIKLLPFYTKDGNLILDLVNELEELFAEMEVLAVEAFVDIKQEEIQQQKDFSDSITENSIDSILAFDTELRCTAWNKKMEETNKLKKEQVIGKRLLDLFPNYRETEDAKAMQRVLRGEKVFFAERPYMGRKGFYEVTMVPLYGINKEVIGGISFIHDVTESKEAEEKLKIYQRELVEANEELTATNEELRESQEELMAANEELREGQEELLVLNEELTESIKTTNKVQKTLLATQKSLMEAQAIAHLGSWEWDVVKNEVTWTNEMFKIFGYEPGEIAIDFETYLNHIHKSDKEMVKRTVFNTYQTQQPYTFENRIVQKNGNIRWLSAKGRITEVANGKVLRMGGIAYDITDQKNAEEALGKSRDYYLTILNDFPTLIWKCGTDTKFDYFNKTWLEYTGRTLEQEVGDGYAKNIHPNDLEASSKIFMESFSARKSFVLIYRLRRFDGKYRWFRVFGKPIYDLNGTFSGFIGTCYDTQDKKEKEIELNRAYLDLKEANEELVRTEELLKEMNNELEDRVRRRTSELEEKNTALVKINDDLDNFVYTASHDLKAPIANLELLIANLRKKLEDKLDDSLIKIFNMIGTSITKFNKTIKDLTEITQVQKDISEDFEPVNLKEVLEDVKGDVAKMIIESGVVITEDFEVPAIIYAKKNLRSIFYNFLSNAIKYRSSERKATVHFSTKDEGEYTLLTVKDNGLGIPPEHREKMFTMFKRFHSHVEGTGIGLYIVKRIIENNGGRIKVESKVNEGTSFIVLFKNRSVY